MELETVDKKYEIVEGGGSLILAYQVVDQKVVVVGGGEVALSRIRHLLVASAKVILIAPSTSLHPSIQDFIASRQIFKYRDKEFDPTDLEDPEITMVLSEILDTSSLIYKLCKEQKIPVNVADQVDKCDFWFMSTYRDGPLQLAISSNGKAPRLASNLRRQLTKMIPENLGLGWHNFGKLRVAIRNFDPDSKSSPKRMGWLSKFADSWSLDELVQLNDAVIEELVRFYEKDQVPTFQQLPSQTHSTIATVTTEVTNSFQNLNTEENKEGKLYLVGAGPGDPDLLTVKALKLLQSAQLIVTDRLVSQHILDLIPINDGEIYSEKIKVAPAKVIGTSVTVQDQLNSWVIQGLQQGFTVVRLKVGDPTLFGRLAEELEFFKQFPYQIQVIPGISSALGPPSTLQLPITQRNVTDKIVITTGTSTKGSLPNLPPYDINTCLVLLMAVHKLQQIRIELRKLDYPDNLPVTTVMNYSLPNEKIFKSKLSSLVEDAETNGIEPPAVIYLGWNLNFNEQV